MPLPDLFLTRFESLCPPALFKDAMTAFQRGHLLSFRINRLKHRYDDAVIESLSQQGIEATPVYWLDAFSVYTCPLEQHEALTSSREAEHGDIYIQTLSSMMATCLLGAEPDEWNLDIAASGKTILMAELMQNQGKISAVEPVKGRFLRLQANLERMGVNNTRCYMKDGRSIGKLKPDTFDRVMLAAPCSSERRFRTDDPDTTRHWSVAKVAEYSKKQKRLIVSAWDALKPGGTLMYCTGSFSPEENEKVVTHLLRKYQEAELVPLHVPLNNVSPGITEWQGRALNPACAFTLRVWPDHQMDGFFMALIRKP